MIRCGNPKSEQPKDEEEVCAYFSPTHITITHITIIIVFLFLSMHACQSASASPRLRPLAPRYLRICCFGSDGGKSLTELRHDYVN